jgi:hypothetical protein
MAQRSRRTWVSVVIAAVICIGMLAVAAVGGTAYFIYHHVRTEFTPQNDAEQRFAEARGRFAGQRPLIETRHGDDPVVHTDAIPRASAKGAKLESLRVLAYDTRARKLVNVSIPFWLLRMTPTNKFSFLSDNGIDFDAERVHITVDDLERRGPGLILDETDRRGSQVLVWTE